MKQHIINNGRVTRLLDWFPAEILSRLPPGLFVDAGAAIGDKVRQMLEANPAAHVIAFEPFDGNLIYLRRMAQTDPRLTVRPVALADYDGSAQLCVPNVVSGEIDPRRIAMDGASMVGSLKKSRRTTKGMVQEVPVTRLDSEIDVPVRFLKIDVQGGENNILRGARKLIEDKGIDFLYVEFNGDLRVLRFLDAHDYLIFDCVYMMWPARFAPRNWLRRRGAKWMPSWRAIRHLDLHTGARAVHVWPPVPFRSLVLYCAWFWFMRLFVCDLQTDLFCVHRSQRDLFGKIWLALRVENAA